MGRRGGRYQPARAPRGRLLALIIRPPGRTFGYFSPAHFSAAIFQSLADLELVEDFTTESVVGDGKAVARGMAADIGGGRRLRPAGDQLAVRPSRLRREPARPVGMAGDDEPDAALDQQVVPFFVTVDTERPALPPKGDVAE